MTSAVRVITTGSLKKITWSIFLTVFLSVCRLRSGKRLYNARLHVEAGEPVPDPVAAPILLSVPQPCGVEGGGRVTGEFTSQHTHLITLHVHVCHFHVRLS